MPRNAIWHYGVFEWTLFRITSSLVCVFAGNHNLSHEADEQLGSGTDGIEGALKGTAEELPGEEKHGREQAHSHQNHIKQNDSLADLFAEVTLEGEQKERDKGDEIDADDTEHTRSADHIRHVQNGGTATEQKNQSGHKHVELEPESGLFFIAGESVIDACCTGDDGEAGDNLGHFPLILLEDQKGICHNQDDSCDEKGDA